MTSDQLPPKPCSELTPHLNLTRDEMKSLIEQVRAEVLKDYAENPDNYDTIDLDYVRNNDWQVERFIRRKHTVEASVQMIKETCKWRREMNMPRLENSDFPEEFFRIGAMFDYGHDRSGNGLVYMRIRRHKKVHGFELGQKRFILHIVNKVDKEVGGKGLAIIFDCGGCGLSNVDMDILWFLLESMVKYFPAGLSYILVYDLPWILTSVWNMIRAWLPPEYKDLIKFASKNEIFNYIDKEQVPRYMGGTCKRNMYIAPKECLPYIHPKFKDELTEKELKQIRKVFTAHLDEAAAEEKSFYSDAVLA